MNLRSFTILGIVLFMASPSARAQCPSAKAKPEKAERRIRSGDTLFVIARNHYGHRCEDYALFLEAFNRVEPKRLLVGTRLALPSFSEGMKTCGAAAAVPDISGKLIRIVEEFGVLEKDIISQRRNQVHGQDIKKRLTEIIKDVRVLSEDVRKSEKLPKPVATSIATALDEAHEALTLVGVKHADRSGNDSRRVHPKLARALCELVKFGWSTQAGE